MIIHQTDNYIRACMKTWLLCDACVRAETNKSGPRESLILKCSSCASACFTVVCKLITNSGATSDAALTCLLSCRECAEECEKHPKEEDLQFCGEVSGRCADILKYLTVPVFLN